MSRWHVWHGTSVFSTPPTRKTNTGEVMRPERQRAGPHRTQVTKKKKKCLWQTKWRWTKTHTDFVMHSLISSMYPLLPFASSLCFKELSSVEGIVLILSCYSLSVDAHAAYKRSNSWILMAQRCGQNRDKSERASHWLSLWNHNNNLVIKLYGSANDPGAKYDSRLVFALL